MTGPVTVEIPVLPAQEKGNPYLSLQEILRHKIAWDWLVERLLKSGGVYQLHGMWKAGKSLVAIDMALHLAQGESWHGRRVMRALVVYVAGEAVEDIEVRIQAYSVAHGLADDAPFYLRTKPVYLTGEAYAQGLSDEIAQLRRDWPNLPVAVFIDTLARNFGAGKSESNDADMGAFINNVIDLVARPHKATAVVVHHPGHGNKERGRGHSSLPGAVDGTLMVEQRDGIITLSTTEMRNIASDEGAMAWSISGVTLDSKDNFGNPLSPPVLVPEDVFPHAASSASGLGKHQATALSVLRELIEHAEDNTQGNSIARIPWHLWKDSMQHAGIPRQRIPEQRNTLVARGLVDQDGDNYRLSRSER